MRNKRKQLSRIPNSHRNGRGLFFLTIDPAFDLLTLLYKIRNQIRPQGAKGIKPLGPGPLAVHFLQVAGGHIVTTGETPDRF